MAVTDDAIAQIKAMITSGELGPGDRLPPEKELSEKLGLSRNSLREAVKALELIQVLDVRRGDGTYVTSLEPHLLVDALGFLSDLDRDDTIAEALEVRRILEPAAAALATRRIDSEALAELQQLLDASRESETVEELVATDMAFHRAITAAAGNRYLESLIESISGSTARARVWRGIADTGAVERTLAEHDAILQAMRAQDTALVHALVVSHIAGVQRWVDHTHDRTVTTD